MTRYTKDNPLRVVTLCSGYDSQCLALERCKKIDPDFDYDLVAWSEIDRYAVEAHNALFPQWSGRNLGDMTRIDWEKVPDFDMLFYSTPCQSISQAGLQHGFTEGSGTRSSIIWNVRDALRVKRPRMAILENVRAMVSSKFVGMFNLWQRELENFGYTNHARVLNAKDYGVPQNRERIFLVSLLDGDFAFGRPFPLERRLRDVLEDRVDEKYYLDDGKVLAFLARLPDKTLAEYGIDIPEDVREKCRGEAPASFGDDFGEGCPDGAEECVSDEGMFDEEEAD